jgi:hypothetical protein
MLMEGPIRRVSRDVVPRPRSLRDTILCADQAWATAGAVRAPYRRRRHGRLCCSTKDTTVRCDVIFNQAHHNRFPSERYSSIFCAVQ